MQGYSNHANMHSYCSKNEYIQWYTKADVGSFLVKLCKTYHFFYFASINAITLRYSKIYNLCLLIGFQLRAENS